MKVHVLTPGCYFVSFADTTRFNSIQCNTSPGRERDKVILSIYCMAVAACYLASPSISYKRLLKLAWQLEARGLPSQRSWSSMLPTYRNNTRKGESSYDHSYTLHLFPTPKHVL